MLSVVIFEGCIMNYSNAFVTFFFVFQDFQKELVLVLITIFKLSNFFNPSKVDLLRQFHSVCGNLSAFFSGGGRGGAVFVLFLSVLSLCAFKPRKCFIIKAVCSKLCVFVRDLSFTVQ